MFQATLTRGSCCSCTTGCGPATSCRCTGPGGCCAPTPSWLPAPGWREESILLAENGVSVDLVAGKASVAGAVPVGKMFVEGLITGDVGDITLGERLILSSGFVAVTVVVKRGTGRPAAAPHLHSRGFSEDPKALEPAVRKVEAELESAGRRQRDRSDPDRAGRAPHRRQVGGRNLSPAADDRADGHRGLNRPLGLFRVGRPFQLRSREFAAGGLDIALDKLVGSGLLHQPPTVIGDKPGDLVGL